MEYEDLLSILNKSAEKYKDKVQKELKNCIICQPYDGGDYIWIMGNETTIEEILENLNCLEKYREDIAAHLYCPNCGKSGFEQYEVAGTEDLTILQEEKNIKRLLFVMQVLFFFPTALRLLDRTISSYDVYIGI